VASFRPAEDGRSRMTLVEYAVELLAQGLPRKRVNRALVDQGSSKESARVLTHRAARRLAASAQTKTADPKARRL
jgi:hypothetical protein